VMTLGSARVGGLPCEGLIGALSHWARVGERAAVWEERLGVSEEFVRVLRHGISDLPEQRLEAGRILPADPQTPQDMEFGRIYLEAGCGVIRNATEKSPGTTGDAWFRRKR
jgi:hypothetical protein